MLRRDGLVARLPLRHGDAIDVRPLGQLLLREPELLAQEARPLAQLVESLDYLPVEQAIIGGARRQVSSRLRRV